jgi:hypothetical protein
MLHLITHSHFLRADRRSRENEVVRAVNSLAGRRRCRSGRHRTGQAQHERQRRLDRVQQRRGHRQEKTEARR